MQWFDYAVLTVLGLSLLVGILRGLMRENGVSGGWIAAFVLATAFSGIVSAHMPRVSGPCFPDCSRFCSSSSGCLC